MKNNAVLFDDAGKPSIMVRIPKFNLSDVIDGAPDDPHPAFVVGGNVVPEIWVSKYQNIIVGGAAYSLPFQQPADNVTFDDARRACEAKGRGWHLLTNAEWAAIALWCKKNERLPGGNNRIGADYRNSNEKGIRFDRSGKVLTGSGPARWSHDGTPDGVYDLNGNVCEWVSGLRLMNGEIHIIPDNDAADLPDLTENSNEWKPIIVNGKSVKYTETDDGIALTTGHSEGWNGCRYADLKSDVEVPLIAKALCLFPEGYHGTDWFVIDTDGERLPFRGGSWFNGANAGVFALDLLYARSDSAHYVGFRSAFVHLESE
ncbi:SUMF1/EgtB/PvdO family nonheme iron enzyme [Paenibacillus naphthalenovorans]|uniref:SUMF1/EgtB/PvdO family nonheme iron enzyme n=1 Tax=Paenibacillus naphthalenovorans TaxID=162209 RepID=UPI003D2D8336